MQSGSAIPASDAGVLWPFFSLNILSVGSGCFSLKNRLTCNGFIVVIFKLVNVFKFLSFNF